MKKIVKKNYKIIIGIVIGIIISTTVAYGANEIISDKDVSYDNGQSHGSSTNVQGAIDELYSKIYDKPKITAYTYNETKGDNNYCVNGEERTCKKTECYKYKTKGSCPQGTIIKYYVRENEYHYFYVLHDDGNKITMQQRENTVRNILWNNEPTTSNGPITILKALEQATSTWTNVNVIEYTPGETELNGNKFTGCTLTEDEKVTCDRNVYTLETKKVRARMITAQEVVSTGCRYQKNHTCPEFMFNYLYDSIAFGGSYNDNTVDESGAYNYDYWAMQVSLSASYSNAVWIVRRAGDFAYDSIFESHAGARAVVEINKT